MAKHASFENIARMSLCAAPFEDAQSTSLWRANRAHWAEATRRTKPGQGLSGKIFQNKDAAMANSDQATAHTTIHMTM